MAQVTPSDCTHTWHWELESDGAPWHGMGVSLRSLPPAGLAHFCSGTRFPGCRPPAPPPLHPPTPHTPCAGWYKAHDALRADLTALDGALAAFRAQLAGGRPLAAPQAAAAGRFLGVFLKFMHHHHHNEEEVRGARRAFDACGSACQPGLAVARPWMGLAASSTWTHSRCLPSACPPHRQVAMPYMATRVQLPDKIASDHKELVVSGGGRRQGGGMQCGAEEGWRHAASLTCLPAPPPRRPCWTASSSACRSCWEAPPWRSSRRRWTRRRCDALRCA